MHRNPDNNDDARQSPCLMRMEIFCGDVRERASKYPKAKGSAFDPSKMNRGNCMLA
jgi:hypothetical protein